MKHSDKILSETIDYAKETLGLRDFEVAKILGIPRYSVNGVHLIDTSLYLDNCKKLKKIVEDADNRYEKELIPIMRTILIDGKTLVNHLQCNLDNKNKMLCYFQDAHSKSKNIIIIKTNIDPVKLKLRTIGIGKIG